METRETLESSPDGASVGNDSKRLFEIEEITNNSSDATTSPMHAVARGMGQHNEGCEGDERLAAILQLQLVQQKQEMMAIEEARAVTNADALFRRGLEALIGEHLNTCMQAASEQTFDQSFGSGEGNCRVSSLNGRVNGLDTRVSDLDGRVSDLGGRVSGSDGGLKGVDAQLDEFGSVDSTQGGVSFGFRSNSEELNGGSLESGTEVSPATFEVSPSNKADYRHQKRGLEEDTRFLRGEDPTSLEGDLDGGAEEEDLEEGRLVTRRRSRRSRGLDTVSRDAELVALAQMQAVSTMLDASFLQDEPAASPSRRDLDFEPYMQRAHLEALQRWQNIEIQRHLEAEEARDRARSRGVVRRRSDSAQDVCIDENADGATLSGGAGKKLENNGRLGLRSGNQNMVENKRSEFQSRSSEASGSGQDSGASTSQFEMPGVTSADANADEPQQRPNSKNFLLGIGGIAKSESEAGKCSPLLQTIPSLPNTPNLQGLTPNPFQTDPQSAQIHHRLSSCPSQPDSSDAHDLQGSTSNPSPTDPQSAHNHQGSMPNTSVANSQEPLHIQGPISTPSRPNPQNSGPHYGSASGQIQPDPQSYHLQGLTSHPPNRRQQEFTPNPSLTGLQTPATSVSELIQQREKARARAEDDVERERQMSRRRAAQRDRFLELEAAWERERERELAGLGQQRVVSAFAHRTRLQSLFRGRFLRQSSDSPDAAPQSHTPRARVEEMGVLRERRPVSGIRELFRHTLENIVRRQAAGERPTAEARVSENRALNQGAGAGLAPTDGMVNRARAESAQTRRTTQDRWVDEANGNNMELQELLTRRSVSTILTSEFRNRLEELVNSLVLTRVGTTAHPLLNPQGAAPQTGPVNQAQPAATPPPPPPLPQAPFWQPAHVAPAAPARWHTGGSGSHDLRESVRQLQEELAQMRGLMENCFEMQLELQRSIRQEVAGALHRPSDAGRESPAEPLDGAKWAAIKRGVCCVCCETGIDALLYRCGHMCACHSCARQLQQSTGKCPLCRAPIVEVVRAFTTA